MTTIKRPKRRSPHPCNYRPTGELNPAAVLTESDVVAIRRRLAAGERKYPLAAEYGVTPSNIRAIAEGRSWTHLL
jgi:hypothetical protein